METEAALLLLLRRRARKPDVARAVADAILIGRQASRVVSLERLQAELRALNSPMADRIDGVSLPSLVADEARAAKAAGSYAEALAKRAEQLRAEGAEAKQAANVARLKEAYRLERIATTEAAQAFSAERRRVAQLFDPETTFRVWNSELDKDRTCEICWNAHGTVVPIGEAFPDGEPGGVHPHCRCYEELTTGEWLDLDGWQKLGRQGKAS